MSAFTPDGYYRTRDLVRRLPSGHLVVERRSVDRIMRGGEETAAEEMENHLLSHPGVHDAAVVSVVADEYPGERRCAFVIPRPGRPTILELRRFLLARGLTESTMPARIELMDRFPLAGLGRASQQETNR
jgi:2,3-dihydroxybenzoate-AMP ligase